MTTQVPKPVIENSLKSVADGIKKDLEATKKKTVHVCKQCGADAIIYDGRYTWSSNTQSYVIVGEIDGATCGECSVEGLDIVQEKEVTVS